MERKSQYSAITGCTFLYYEFQRILPLLMDKNSEILLRDEIENNHVIQINSLSSRKRFISDFKKRYASVPRSFWEQWLQWSEQAQRVGLLYVILKTYRLLFDLHINVSVKKWSSVNHQLIHSDIMMEFNEISSHDSFVNSWSEATKKKSSSTYLTILRQIGMLDQKTNELMPIKLEPEEYGYYVKIGEEWFLEACFLYPYEINDIKSSIS